MKFLTGILIATLMLFASYDSQSSPPGKVHNSDYGIATDHFGVNTEMIASYVVNDYQYAMLNDDPGLPPTEVVDTVPDTSSQLQVDPTGAWIDPAKLPPKDPMGVFGLGWEFILSLLYGVISVIIYFFPTASKYKWLTWLPDFIHFLVPNKKKGGGSHQATLWDVLSGKG